MYQNEESQVTVELIPVSKKNDIILYIDEKHELDTQLLPKLNDWSSLMFVLVGIYLILILLFIRKRIKKERIK